MLSLNTDTSFKQQKNAFSMFMEVNDTSIYTQKILPISN